jgi:hypothetical protein
MTRRKFNWLGDLVINALFGKQIGDDEEARKSPTWRYQKRQNKLVALGGLLFVGFATLCVWEASTESTRAGITVAFVCLVFINERGLSAASDAIFDSLFERINLQSAWLDARLTEIETNTAKDGKPKAQERWLNWPIDEDAHYYSSPERYRKTDPSTS